MIYICPTKNIFADVFLLFMDSVRSRKPEPPLMTGVFLRQLLCNVTQVSKDNSKQSFICHKLLQHLLPENTHNHHPQSMIYYILGGHIFQKCSQNFPPNPWITLYICKTENSWVWSLKNVFLTHPLLTKVWILAHFSHFWHFWGPY